MMIDANEYRSAPAQLNSATILVKLILKNIAEKIVIKDDAVIRHITTGNETASLHTILHEFNNNHGTNALDVSMNIQTHSGNVQLNLIKNSKSARYKYRYRYRYKPQHKKILFFILGMLSGILLTSIARDFFTLLPE